MKTSGSELVKSVTLRMPSFSHIPEYIRENKAFAVDMCEAGSRKGKTLTICGAGPSLSEYQDSLTSEVWAVNSALPYLKKRGFRVTHGLTIDQGPEMVTEWGETYDVTYILASSVNPLLREHLKNRSIFWFHNHTGTEGEMELYREYPKSVCVGQGLNGVPRALCLAEAMGFERVVIYGADSSARPDYDPMPQYQTPEYHEWMKGLKMYADGRTALECWGKDSPFVEAPDLDGRRWHTRPDMVVSAIHLLALQVAWGNVEIVGDVLPNALKKLSPDELKDLPVLTPDGQVTGFGEKAA